jgi:hypothetical protein
VASFVMHEEIVDLGVFRKHYGAARFFVKQGPFTNSVLTGLILRS